MWKSSEMQNIKFLNSYLARRIDTCDEEQLHESVKAFLEHELKKHEDMLFQMGIQKGFHEVLDRYPKATRDKVLGKQP